MCLRVRSGDASVAQAPATPGSRHSTRKDAVIGVAGAGKCMASRNQVSPASAGSRHSTGKVAAWVVMEGPLR